jgi:hypothetical protein
MTVPVYRQKSQPEAQDPSGIDQPGLAHHRSDRQALPARRAIPSRFDRLIGATNLAFAAWFILSRLIIPAIGRLPANSPAITQAMGSELFTLLLAVLIAIAGFEKWTGRREWALVLATRCAPQTRGDPLAYTLLVVLTWFFWKGFAYSAALVALFHLISSLLRATGRF